MNLSHFWYRFKYRYGRQLRLQVPVDVSLELSSECNMRCSYCYHSDQDKLPFHKGFMGYETASKILCESADLGVPALKMNWKGESSVNPKFFQITAMAKRLANGSTFQERISNSNFKFYHGKEEIFEGFCNQTKVKISFDSFNKEVFETQRRGGSWDTTFKNIDKFYNYPSRKNTEMVIQAVRTKLNKDEDLEGQVKKHWPEATLSIRDMVGGRTDTDVSKLEDRKRNTSGRQSCLQAHVRLIFNWKGIAFPCCPDIGEKLALGNIHEKTVYEIFNGHPARNLRKSLNSKEAFVLDPCKGCSSFETYLGYKPAWNS